MKKYLFGLFTGLFISSSVVFAANYLYHADEVSYDPKDINWNVDSVDSAIKELYNKISDTNSALLNLKNTDIAKAVGADGDTFSSVINRLGSITNQGDKSFTLSDTNSITIPAGYYNGQGTITTLGLIPTPTATKTITSNGNNIDVTNYKTVDVNVNNKPPLTYGLVYANGIKASSTSINLSGYDRYIISVHCWNSSSNVTASGCGAVRLSQTVDEGTLSTFVCTSSGTVTIYSSVQFQNIHVVGIKNS